MTSLLLARVEFPHTSGLPEDSAFMDLTIRDVADVVVDTGPLVVTQAIDGLFNDTHTTGGAPHNIAEFISGAVERSALACKVKYYDITAHLSGTPVGSPVAVDSFTLLGSETNNALPREVSCVVTLRGEDWDQVAVSTPGGAPGPEGDVRPRQRRTGRVYVGPLNTSTLANDTNHRSYVSDVCRGALLNGFFYFQTELVAAGYQLEVWSRKNASTYPCVRVEVDDAFDIQRRRGEDATVRLNQTLPTLA